MLAYRKEPGHLVRLLIQVWIYRLGGGLGPPSAEGRLNSLGGIFWSCLLISELDAASFLSFWSFITPILIINSSKKKITLLVCMMFHSKLILRNKIFDPGRPRIYHHEYSHLFSPCKCGKFEQIRRGCWIAHNPQELINFPFFQLEKLYCNPFTVDPQKHQKCTLLCL